MSDKGHEGEPHRKSSQRTQRYQSLPHNADDPGRRNFIKNIGKGLGAAGLLGLVGWGTSRLFQTGNQEVKPTSTPIYPNRTLTPEPIKSEYLGLANQLRQLDQEVTRNPQNFKELTPKIGALTVEFFCKEMGYDPKKYEGRLRYQNNNEYQTSRANESSCITLDNNDDEFGRVQIDRDDLTINIEKILYGKDLNNKKLQQYPAYSLVAILIHELHHLTAPALPTADPQTKIKGMAAFIPNLEKNKPGFICYDSFRVQLEEAIVQDSTDRITQKLGINQPAAERYRLWVERYRIGVLARFFNGDNKPLLRLHQQTRQEEFLKLIGEKYGAPPDKAIQAAENYLKNLIQQGIFT